MPAAERTADVEDGGAVPPLLSHIDGRLLGWNVAQVWDSVFRKVRHGCIAGADSRIPQVALNAASSEQ